MIYQCFVCGDAYSSLGDNFTLDGEFVPPCKEWPPEDGRCEFCWLNMLYEMFGGLMEPCIHFNGEEYREDGKVSPEPADIPF